MKSLYSYLAIFGFLLFSSPSFALDYYWVNGDGKWSEFATHWAKIPVPLVPADYHANVPTSGDDVYFGANGGTAYTLDVNAGSTVPKCRNMDWSGVPAGTVWGGFGSRIEIYGSTTLDPNMSITFNGSVRMTSFEASMKSITSNTVHFGVEIEFVGTDGGWNLVGDFHVNGRVNHEGGLIKTNGWKVTIGDSFFGNYYGNAGQLHLGSSEFNMLGGQAYFRYNAAQFDAGTSHIKMYGQVYLEGPQYFVSPIRFFDVSFFANIPNGQGGFAWGHIDGTLTFHQDGAIHSYGNIVPELKNVVFLGNGTIYNANNYHNLTLTAGKTYTITGYYSNWGTDQTILLNGSLIALGAGSCDQFITIKSWQYGTHFNFVNNSGVTQTVHCAILEDCHATGSDPLEVLDGVDLGNNTGWIFTDPHGVMDLYWIGGAGDWNDSSHWSETDGGPAGTCIPNGATNVYFTVNSGFSLGEQVNVSIDAYCADMDWTGVTGKPEFFHLYGGATNLHIYGSVTLAADMDFNFGGTVRFRTSNTATITSASQDFDYKVVLEGTGTWELQDTFKVLNDWTFHKRGTFKSLGHPMLLNYWWGNAREDATGIQIDMGAELFLDGPSGSSNVFLIKSIPNNQKGHFRCFYEAGKFHAAQSHFIGLSGGYIDCQSNLFHDFWNVTFNPIDHAGDFLYGNILNKLTFLAFGNLIGPNTHIHEVEFHKGAYLFDSHTYDILTIHGGHNFKFQPYTSTGSTVQTIRAGGVFSHINSSCENPTVMHNPTPGETTTFRKEGVGTTFDIQHTIFDRVYADQTSGAIYTATNCVAVQPDVETSWNIINPAARDLYWVGGAGDWHSATHWSLTSGGAVGECPPTVHDNVFFDGGSGLGAGDAVTVNQSFAYCADMDWTGVGNGAVLNNLGGGNASDPFASNNLVIFGSLKFSSSMTNNFTGSVWLRANGAATIMSAGQQFHNNIYFWNPTGSWTLTDDFSLAPSPLGTRTVVHSYGTINTNDQTVSVGGWGYDSFLGTGSVISTSSKLNLGNSVLKIAPNSSFGAVANFNYSSGNLSSGTSKILFESGAYAVLASGAGYPVEFYDVSFKIPNSDFQWGQVNNKLLFEKSGQLTGGNLIKELEFKDDGLFYTVSERTVHSVHFAPGKRYTFQGGFPLTIVPHNGIEGQFIAQGLPGQYIELKSTDFNTPAIIHKDDYDGTSTCTKYLFLTGMDHTGTEDIYVPTPGGDVFNNEGWLFFPCNPCPASIPELDPASVTVGCAPGKATLILENLKPDEWAIWYTDPAAMMDIVYNGGTPGPAGNLFQPDITGPTTYYARVYSDGGLCESTVILTVPITPIDPPQLFNVTGGGMACSGANLEVGLDGSEVDVDYQLQRDGLDVGAALAGTGNALSFGFQNVAGTYTVIATIHGTACSIAMTGSVVIVYDQNLAPAIDVNSNNPVCMDGTNLELYESGGDAVAWVWTGPNSFASSDQNPTIADPTPINSGDYWVEITSSNGCTNQATIPIQVFQIPETRNDCDLFACENAPGSGEAMFDLTSREECITLEAGGVSIRYFTDAALTDEILTPSAYVSGTRTVYTLVIDDITGCTVSGMMQLSVGLLPMPRLEANSIIRVAEPGGQVTLILENLPPGSEAVWYADDQVTVLYADVANFFQTNITQPTTFYGKYRDLNSNCESPLLEIGTCLFNYFSTVAPFSSAPIGAAPGIKFAYTFGTDGGTDDTGRMIVALPDSTYVMAGDGANNCGDRDIYLVKSNCAGDIIWQHAYGGPDHERISWLMENGLHQTPDGGYLIVGETKSYGNGELDNILIKTDADGNQQWIKTYGGARFDYSRGITFTSDGGYLITVYSFSDVPPDFAIHGDIQLIKTDANGNIQWQKLYPKEGWQSPYVGIELPNGGYLTAGTYGLTKVDVNGNELWERPGVTGIGYVLEKTTDGGVMYGGRKSGGDAFMWKLDGNGDPIWPQASVISGANENYVYVIKERANGNFMCAGEQRAPGGGPWDYWFFETDPNGNMIWERTFGSPGNEWATSMKKTIDGDYIAIGLSYGYDNVGKFLTVKLDIIPDALPVLDPASVTLVMQGQQATLILENLPLGYEAVWYDEDKTTELYADDDNLFQPVLTRGRPLYAAFREIATGCEGEKIEVKTFAYYPLSIRTEAYNASCSDANDGDAQAIVNGGRQSIGTGHYEESEERYGFYGFRVNMADFNNDGYPDVYSSTYGGADNLWLNDGDGTYTYQFHDYNSVKSSPRSVAGDFDNDGDLDLYVCNNIANSDKVLVNDGLGGFTELPQSYGMSASEGAQVGDVNDDGDLDVVVVGGGFAVVLLGNGDGSFNQQANFGNVNYHSRGIDLADLDKDGDLDAFVANGAGLGATLFPPDPDKVYLNDGAGNFTEVAEDYGTNEAGWDVQLGDLDADGDKDAFVANWNFEPNQVYFNDGDGTFTVSTQIFPAWESRGVSLADMDCDGDLDAIVANIPYYNGTGSASVRQLLNDGLGVFTIDPVIYPEATDVAVGDIDGDGDKDIFSSNTYSSPWTGLHHVLFNDDNSVKPYQYQWSAGNLVYSPDIRSDLPQGNYSVSVTDEDDNVASVDFQIYATAPIELNTNSTPTSCAAAMNGTATVDVEGGAPFQLNYDIQRIGSNAEATIVLADFDNDNDLDVLAGLYNRVLGINNGSGVFTDISEPTLPIGCYAIVVGNLDGDNNKDILAASANGNQFGYYKSNGNLTFQAPVLYSVPGGGYLNSLRLADLNNDGSLDVFIGDEAGRPNTVWLNNGNGVFTQTAQLLGSEDTYNVELGDLDGDGDTDALCLNLGDGDVVYTNSGSGLFTQHFIFPSGIASSGASLGDIDGDGDLDALVECYGLQATRVYFNNGDATFTIGSQLIPNMGTNREIDLGDMDGDGDLDIVYQKYRSSAPGVLGGEIWLNDGNGYFIEYRHNHSMGIVALSYPLSLGDLDGDSDLDIVVNGGDGVALVFNSPTNYTFLWSDGQTTQTAFGMVSGTYQVTAMDFRGCSATTTASVGDLGYQPPVLLSSNSPLCSGDTLELFESGGAAVSWAWSGPNNFSAFIQNPFIVNAQSNASGTYLVNITDANGCTNTGSIAVTVVPTPTVNQPTNQILCNNNLTTAVNFTGTPNGLAFKWTNNTPSIGLAANGVGNIAPFTALNTGSAPIVATITVTPEYTDNGITCSGLAKTFTITVNPTPTVADPPDQSVCAGQATTAVIFSGSPNGTVLKWTNNNAGIGLAASGTGNIASFVAINNGPITIVATITVTPEYTNGGVSCTGPTQTFTIAVNPYPLLFNLTGQTLYCNANDPGAPVGLSGSELGVNYQLLRNGAPVGVPLAGTGGALDFGLRPAGTYTVAATRVPGGCLRAMNGSLTIQTMVCTIEIADPCSCKNNATNMVNGQFDERIKVNAPSWQNWTVKSVTGLYNASSPAPPAAPNPVLNGTAFNPLGGNMFDLPGVLVDAIGYTITATNGSTDLVIPLRACYYPNPTLLDLGGPYCLLSPDVTLSAKVALNPVANSAHFNVNGANLPATFNAGNGNWEATYDITAAGVYQVNFTFDAGTPTANNPADPGCIQATASQFFNVITTPTNLLCNDLLYVSLDADCAEQILPDQVLEGSYGCYDDYIVEIDRILPYGNGPWESALLNVGDIGFTYAYQLTHLPSGNHCWGNLKVEDKLAPTLVCTDFAIPCNTPDRSPNYLDNVLDISAANPQVSDCQTYTISFIDVELPQVCATGLTAIINRQWTVVDASGNSSNCTQLIRLVRPTLGDVIPPPDYDDFDAPAFHCTDNLPLVNGYPKPTPEWIEAQGLQGYPHVFGQPTGCTINWVWTDYPIYVCDGTIKYRREWSIVDWCAGDGFLYNQILKVGDENGPQMTCPTNLTLSVDPFECCATVNLPDVVVEDNCSRINNLSGMIVIRDAYTNAVISMKPIGGTLEDFPGNNWWDRDTLANFGWTSCLPVGGHTVTYIAEDDCGNTSSCSFELAIADYVPPVASCDETTTVALGGDDLADCYTPADGCDFAGVTWVKATVFNDGSHDNCNNLKFTVRRMEPYSDCINNLSHDPCYPNGDSEYDQASAEQDSIKFYCCEAGTTQTIILAVYQVDANGNVMNGADGEPVKNECMIQVEVQDKLKPSCLPPAQVTVNCENFDPSLWAYGKALVADNCCLDTSKVYQGQCGLSHSVNYALFDTVCNKGTITRTFRAYDCHGFSSSCTQRVVVTYDQDYFVKFPNDVIVTTCDGTGNYGEPLFFGEDCELLGVSFEDEVFTVVPDACFKIERTWQIINWCTYDPNLPCIYVPNPNPNAIANHPTNLPGPTVSACGTLPPWRSTVVKILPTDPLPGTDFCEFWDKNVNCYKYKQIIKIIDGQAPTGTFVTPACDNQNWNTANRGDLWNEMFWWDNGLQIHDLCEEPTDLCITGTDACSGANVNIEYLLFLDLDGNGTMETVINSVNTGIAGLGWNNVQYDNALNPNFSGGTSRAFDERLVPTNQKYGFTIQETVVGNNKTACVRWNTQQQQNTYVTPELPHGTHKIKWFITDGCGNNKEYEYTFTVKDCKAPTVVCLNGLSTNIMPTGMITLWASDFLQYTEDNCTPNPLKIGIRKCGTGTGFPIDAFGNPITQVNFTCAELGTQCVELWAIDAAGNADYCETYVIVQDNNGNCAPGNTVNVSGALKTEMGDGVEEALVNLEGPSFTPVFDLTDADGNYQLSAPLASTFTIAPEKDDNPLNGVTTYDLVLISKHILGLEPLNSPYKMIAADANKSGSITTFDIVELRKLILGIYTELPNNTSWRFVDKSFSFPNANNPFQTLFPEFLSLSNVNLNQIGKDFAGVKIGDVNNTVVANALMQAEERTSGTALFDVADRVVKAGETFEVNFKSAQQLKGFQFTMLLDGLEAIGVRESDRVNASNFGLVFEDAATVSIDGAQEFTLQFRATKSGKLSEMLGVSGSITRAEAYDNEGRKNIAFRYNGKTIAGVGFELYQNQPNPFVNKTNIGFFLPESTEATLSVYDESGRVVYQQKGQFAKGENLIALDRSLLNTNGVLYYELKTATDSATKKMIQAK